MLVLCLKSLIDRENDKPPAGFEPFFVGITVFTIGAAFGINTGYAINPARDLGPRLFTLMAGWGSDTFTKEPGDFFKYPSFRKLIFREISNVITKQILSFYSSLNVH